MARLNNPVLDTSIVVLATAVVFGERVLFPIIKIVVAMLESFVTSLEVSEEPMPQLEVSSKQCELVEAVQSDEVLGTMIIQGIDAG